MAIAALAIAVVALIAALGALELAVRTVRAPASEPSRAGLRIACHMCGTRALSAAAMGAHDEVARVDALRANGWNFASRIPPLCLCPSCAPPAPPDELAARRPPGAA